MIGRRNAARPALRLAMHLSLPALVVTGGASALCAQQADSSSARLPRDTTVTLAIADRQWQRDDVTVGVHLEYGSAAGSRPEWHTSVGVSAQLSRVTASLHGVYGIIHLRTDPAAFEAVRAPRGTTPAPVPPRR
jgi:hypothetical protein